MLYHIFILSVSSVYCLFLVVVFHCILGCLFSPLFFSIFVIIGYCRGLMVYPKEKFDIDFGFVDNE
jgi:hypothetical protein